MTLTPESIVYEADLSLDVASATLAASWRLDYVADDRTTESVSFFLNRGVSIERLEGDAVRSYRTEPFDVPIWNVVTVEMNGTVSPGDPVTLDLAYSGPLELPPSGINQISPEWVELNVESAWYPLFATTDREMTGVLRVDLPAEWDLVTVGPTSFRDGAHVAQNTVPLPDVAFVAAPSFQHVESERFTAYHQGIDPARIRAVLEGAEGCAAYLDSVYGAERRLPPGRLVLTERSGMNYARVNYIVFDHVPDPEDRMWIEGHICHELAHYWTAIGNFMGPDHWMSEAFAEYATALYFREHYGRSEFERRVQSWRAGGAGKGPVWTPDSVRRAAPDAMYLLAPYLLARLEGRIGEERFARFIEAYMVEDVRTTRDLLERLRSVAGEDAERVFRAELGSTGTDFLKD